MHFDFTLGGAIPEKSSLHSHVPIHTDRSDSYSIIQYSFCAAILVNPKDLAKVNIVAPKPGKKQF